MINDIELNLIGAKINFTYYSFLLVWTWHRIYTFVHFWMFVCSFADSQYASTHIYIYSTPKSHEMRWDERRQKYLFNGTREICLTCNLFVHLSQVEKKKKRRKKERKYNKHGFCVEKFMLELKRFGYFSSAISNWGLKSTAILAAAPTTTAAKWE